MPEQVPESPPVRMEVRVGGKIKFANTVYAPTFDVDGANVTIRAALQPTLVDPKPGVRFDRDDPREGSEVLMEAHDGKGTPVEAPRPKTRSKSTEASP